MGPSEPSVFLALSTQAVVLASSHPPPEGDDLREKMTPMQTELQGYPLKSVRALPVLWTLSWLKLGMSGKEKTLKKVTKTVAVS